MKPILVLLTLAALAPVAHADVVDDLIHAERERRHAPGLGVAVLRDGKPVKVAGYGLARLDPKTPADARTLFQLASVTKTFTATAVLMLYDAGKLGLDDPIRKHLPDLPEAWSAVTVRHLLSHTSGIYSYTSAPGFFEKPEKAYTPAELVAFATDKPLAFTPGSKWDYSNTGYVLLGMLVEKVSGKPFGAFLEERIFRPLGMRATRLFAPNSLSGYDWAEKDWRGVPSVHPSQPFSAGALTSNAADMARWAAAVDAGKLLKSDTWKLATTPVALAGGRPADYGLGWMTGERNGSPRIGHNGGIPGFSTSLIRFPKERLTVVVLANAGNADAEAIAVKIAGAYAPALAERTAAVDDPEPAVTAMVQETIARLTAGTVDAERFTPEMVKVLTPERVQGATQMLAKMGKLEEQVLVRREVKDGVRELELRVRFGQSWVRFRAGVTSDRKLAGLGFRPE